MIGQETVGKSIAAFTNVKNQSERDDEDEVELIFHASDTTGIGCADWSAKNA